ncbi:MAG: hypothetical protein JXA77_12310 [Bacteroidales bacterium]|nr:hypothetical protein [Bacteroidales bacterium]MBN2818574.1 hypothetical protein [Bacteroidales bacterium]
MKYTFLFITIGLLSAILISCEVKETWVEPQADMEIWYTDTTTFEDIMLQEPYTLYHGVKYSFKFTGTGASAAFWFGVAGNDKDGSGNDYNDRGINHISKGQLAEDGAAIYTYKEAGKYTLVLVAASYIYSEDKYAEDVISKEITVE